MKLDSLALRYDNGKIWVLDQTELPHREKWLECRDPSDMESFIKKLCIRGAPLIGVGAALALAQLAAKGATRSALQEAGARLKSSRPTAVNLFSAVDRVLEAPHVVEEARRIFLEDVELCESMAERAAAFITEGDGILTHCNTGGLATAGRGTALGAIRKAFEQGKQIHVFVDETRPLLQGARLTTWELQKYGIPFTLICDNMAAALMSSGKVNKVFVGADRIAANGDFANKIGTYSLAVIAKHHGIPFYVVAPQTTLDLSCLSGASINIENRGADEVIGNSAPSSAQVWNPAFDVTHRELVTAIIMDDRIF